MVKILAETEALQFTRKARSSRDWLDDGGVRLNVGREGNALCEHGGEVKSKGTVHSSMNGALAEWREGLSLPHGWANLAFGVSL